MYVTATTNHDVRHIIVVDPGSVVDPGDSVNMPD